MKYFTDEIQQFFSHLENTRRVRTLKAPPAGMTDLCSNDYLCLSRDERLIAALREGIELYGAGSTASRLVSGHRDVFGELETSYAHWVDAEDALFFANGYAANVGTLSAILDAGYAAFADRLCHASLLDGVRLSGARKVYFQHNDLNHLESLLRKAPEKRRIIISESLFSMDGDFAPVTELCELADRYGALLYIDDAHALGVYGDQGKGLSTGADIRVGTFGKALGLEGAMVAGGALLKKFLVHTARTFVFSTAPMPAIAHAGLRAIDLVRKMNNERRELQAVSEKLRHDLHAQGINTGLSRSQIIPALCDSEASALDLASALQTAGYHVKAIRPPTVRQSRLRISLNAGVTPDVARRFAEALVTALRPANQK